MDATPTGVLILHSFWLRQTGRVGVFLRLREIGRSEPVSKENAGHSLCELQKLAITFQENGFTVRF